MVLLVLISSCSEFVGGERHSRTRMVGCLRGTLRTTGTVMATWSFGLESFSLAHESMDIAWTQQLAGLGTSRVHIYTALRPLRRFVVDVLEIAGRPISILHHSIAAR